jgi:surfeit locus 1 family protein
MRRILFPILASLPVLAVLLALGTWQVQRLHWKTDLLERVAEAEAGPPVPLAGQPASFTPEPFTKVVATGRLDHGREALLGISVRGTTLGGNLLTPLLRPDAPPLLVNRGWVPLERPAGIDRPEGEVAITGYIREADTRDWNSPRDDPAARRFFLFDPPVIGAALRLPPPEPFGLVALAPPDAPADALPAAATALPRPENPHLGYAITWYGLAVALLGVLVAFLFHRRDKDPAA